MDSKQLGFFIILVILLIVGIVFFRKKFKRLVLPNVVLITGAPKTGKSALSVHLAIKQYRKNLIAWHIGKCLWWLRYHNLKAYPIKPMLYSNIPLKYPHNMLTKDILLRRVKIPRKSVVLMDEVSLLADSMMFKNDSLNFQLLLFFKLYGHLSYGGYIFANSHTISDLHYSIKRVIGRYLYIYQTTKFPFVSLAQVREMAYSDDSNIVNNVNEDVEMSMRKILFLNRNYKKYDCFCYSVFTDNLMYQVDYDYDYKKKDLKAYHIVSFNPRIDNMKVGGKK